MKVDTLRCDKCQLECKVDGEYPKFFVWCYECHSYIDDEIMKTYTVEYYADLIEQTYEGMR